MYKDGSLYENSLYLLPTVRNFKSLTDHHFTIKRPFPWMSSVTKKTISYVDLWRLISACMDMQADQSLQWPLMSYINVKLLNDTVARVLMKQANSCLSCFFYFEKRTFLMFQHKCSVVRILHTHRHWRLTIKFKGILLDSGAPYWQNWSACLRNSSLIIWL